MQCNLPADSIDYCNKTQHGGHHIYMGSVPCSVCKATYWYRACACIVMTIISAIFYGGERVNRHKAYLTILHVSDWMFLMVPRKLQQSFSRTIAPQKIKDPSSLLTHFFSRDRNWTGTYFPDCLLLLQTYNVDQYLLCAGGLETVLQFIVRNMGDV